MVDFVNQLPNEVFPRINFFTRTTATLPTPAGVEEYRQLGRNSRNRETTTGLSLQPNFTLTKSKHSVRGGLDFRMGRSLKFPRVAHNRLLLSLAHGFGHELKTFGNPNFCKDGPLTGLA